MFQFLLMFPWLILIVPAVVVAGGVLWFLLRFARRAKTFGYASTKAYLRAVPASDAERRDAADLVLKGVVLCALGVAFGPLVLPGLVPLFYGGRKVIHSFLGLGLIDDADA